MLYLEDILRNGNQRCYSHTSNILQSHGYSYEQHSNRCCYYNRRVDKLYPPRGFQNIHLNTFRTWALKTRE